MDGLIAVNGQIYSPSEAKIPALDRGFLFGDNVFEVFVAFHGKILDLAPHFRRLRQSASELRLDIPWSDEEMNFEIQAMLEQLELLKANVRLVVTRGAGLGLGFPDVPSPNRVVYVGPAKVEPPHVHRDGVSLKKMLLPFTERGANPKTGNYLRSILALEKARTDGFEDILWVNSSGEITESSTANIFFIGRIGDQVEITTPPAHSGILMGITRMRILELLNSAKIRATEQLVFADELARFDEAFICSTVRGLVPLTQIDSHKLHTSRPQAIFRHIERLYLTWVESELGFRVDWNTGEPTLNAGGDFH